MHRVLRAGAYVGTLDRRFTALETLGVAAWRERENLGGVMEMVSGFQPWAVMR